MVERRVCTAAITGASGFIGRALTAALATSGIQVRALARNTSGLAFSPAVEAIPCDITEPQTLDGIFSGVDTVFHAAGFMGRNSAGEERFRLVNEQGTQNVLRAARASASVTRFVHISTAGVFHTLDPEARIDEESTPNPRSLYGISKLGAEQAVLACDSNFEVVVVRPTWVYGPGSSSAQKLFQAIANGRMVLIGSTLNRVQPIYIDDLICALQYCAKRLDLRREVFHLAGPTALTAEEMCREIAAALGVHPPRVRVPLWFADLAARTLEAIYSGSERKLPLDQQKIDFFRLHHQYSLAKAASVLHWQPVVPFSDGARNTIAESVPSAA